MLRTRQHLSESVTKQNKMFKIVNAAVINYGLLYSTLIVLDNVFCHLLLSFPF